MAAQRRTTEPLNHTNLANLAEIYRLYYALVTRLNPFSLRLVLFSTCLPNECDKLIPERFKKPYLNFKLLEELGYGEAVSPDLWLKLSIERMIELVGVNDVPLLHDKDTGKAITCSADLRELWKKLGLNEGIDHLESKNGQINDRHKTLISSLEKHFDLLDAYFCFEHNRNLSKIAPPSRTAPLPLYQEQKSNTFRKGGDYWEIVFEEKAFHLKNSQGLEYVHWLLQHPGQEFLVLELMQIVRKQPRIIPARKALSASELAEEGINFSTGPDYGEEILDLQAVHEYRNCLRELEEEIEGAEKTNDTGQLYKLQRDKEYIKNELSKALGLNGSIRKSTSAVEKARISVTMAVDRSLDAIKKESPALWRHLKNSIKTGTFLSYSPAELIHWEL